MQDGLRHGGLPVGLGDVLVLRADAADEDGVDGGRVDVTEGARDPEGDEQRRHRDAQLVGLLVGRPVGWWPSQLAEHAGLVAARVDGVGLVLRARGVAPRVGGLPRREQG